MTRRYKDEEIREIFELASRESESKRRSVTPADGLPLEEIKQIGQEVGMPPERIERAAASLDRPDTPTPQATFLGAVGLGANALRLPSWAKTREKQLHYIAERALEVTSGDDD